jgi:hypothetical protein
VSGSPVPDVPQRRLSGNISQIKAREQNFVGETECSTSAYTGAQLRCSLSVVQAYGGRH